MNKILIIDDDEMMRETIVSYLSGKNYAIITAANGLNAEEIIGKQKPDVVVSDVRMPEKDGIELLKFVKDSNSHVPVVLMTAFGDVDITIKAMQLGAYDYIEKPIDKERINFIVKRALETKHLSDRLELLDLERDELEKNDVNFIGKSEAISNILKKVGQISSNKVTVLIQGESGTGKELISKIIHNSGITRKHPFVAVNSTTIPETLLESELFGHVKGSFTDAYRDKIGKFEIAGYGTILLDEIGDIAPSLQAKLLRVIQEREFDRVGGEETIPLNARIIVATNKDLESLVHQGKFREDLYYRLNVFNINIPPLRERRNDIPLLILYFINKINRSLNKRVNKIPYEVVEMLLNYHWPGNVRELENILMQAIVLAKGEVIEKQNILLENTMHYHNNSYSENLSLAEVERMHIKFILDKVQWNKQEAANLLKISKQTLYNKIKALKIIPA